MLGAVVVLIGGFALFIQVRGIPSFTPEKISLKVEVTPERVANGRKIVNLLCSNCHFDQVTNRLSGKQMLDAPPAFGEIWSRNITNDPVNGIGSWTDGEIAYLLRTGIKKNGGYSPPWMVKLPLMADEDLNSVIAFLRSSDTLVQASPVQDHESKTTWFAKFLCFVAFKPLPYPTLPIPKPQLADKIAYGKYIATGVAACFDCHSADFSKVNDLEPEKSGNFFGGGTEMGDASGRILYTPNITFDKETGIGNWTEDQFVNTMITGIRADHTPFRYPMDRMPDLSKEELSAVYAYLKTVPGSKMPTWEGTIQESEYVPLCEYVRLLGEKSASVASR